VSGREGQALRWVPVNELAALPLLEADAPIIEALKRLEVPAQQSASKNRTS
jgi:hypothetical protein